MKYAKSALVILVVGLGLFVASEAIPPEQLAPVIDFVGRLWTAIATGLPVLAGVFIAPGILTVMHLQGLHGDPFEFAAQSGVFSLVFAGLANLLIWAVCVYWMRLIIKRPGWQKPFIFIGVFLIVPFIPGSRYYIDDFVTYGFMPAAEWGKTSLYPAAEGILLFALFLAALPALILYLFIIILWVRLSGQPFPIPDQLETLPGWTKALMLTYIVSVSWMGWSLILSRTLFFVGLWDPFAWASDAPKRWFLGTIVRIRDWSEGAHKFGREATGAWASFIEIMSLRFREGDIFLGRPKLYIGGLMRPIGTPTEKHMVTIAGTGSGKSTSALIPNICIHRGSMLCIDPKGELAAITARRRGPGGIGVSGMGQNVFVVDPFHIVPGWNTSSYNVFDEMARVASYDADRPVSYAGKIAEAIVKPMGEKDSYWDNAAQTLLRGLILYVFAHEPPERRNLVRLRQLLMEGDVDTHKKWVQAEKSGAQALNAFDVLLEEMRLARSGPYGDAISAAAASITMMGGNQMGAVITTAQEHTTFLDTPEIRNISTHSDFLLEDLKYSWASVYLCLPINAVTGKEGCWLRMFVLLFIDMMMRVQQAPNPPILLAIDEFPSLGRLDGIEFVAPVLRSYGARFWAIGQDIEQFERVYPKSWQGFIGGAEAVQFMGITHPKTVNFISELLGDHIVKKRVNYDGRYRSEEFQRKMLDANQVAQILSKDRKNQIIWRGNKRPLMLKTTPYYWYMPYWYYDTDQRFRETLRRSIWRWGRKQTLGPPLRPRPVTVSVQTLPPPATPARLPERKPKALPPPVKETQKTGPILQDYVFSGSQEAKPKKSAVAPLPLKNSSSSQHPEKHPTASPQPAIEPQAPFLVTWSRSRHEQPPETKSPEPARKKKVRTSQPEPPQPAFDTDKLLERLQKSLDQTKQEAAAKKGRKPAAAEPAPGPPPAPEPQWSALLEETRKEMNAPRPGRDAAIKAPMLELEEMIGPASVKTEVKSLLRLLRFDVSRVKAGVPELNWRAVIFAGNPGSGKRHVARLVGSICKEKEVLKSGHLVEVRAHDLIGTSKKQTDGKISKAVEAALDGVLFIGDAHELMGGNLPQARCADAVTALLKAVEIDGNRLVVIAAGPSADMERFMASDPDIQSLFRKTPIHFHDYDSKDLLNIFVKMASDAGYRLSHSAKLTLPLYIRKTKSEAGELFTNGHAMKRLLHDCMALQAARLAASGKIEKVDVTMLESSDLPAFDWTAGAKHETARP